MKLLEVKNKVVKGVEYRRFMVILPRKMIEELGWCGGDELVCYIDDIFSDGLIIERKDDDDDGSDLIED